MENCSCPHCSGHDITFNPQMKRAERRVSGGRILPRTRITSVPRPSFIVPVNELRQMTDEDFARAFHSSDLEAKTLLPVTVISRPKPLEEEPTQNGEMIVDREESPIQAATRPDLPALIQETQVAPQSEPTLKEILGDFQRVFTKLFGWLFRRSIRLARHPFAQMSLYGLLFGASLYLLMNQAPEDVSNDIVQDEKIEMALDAAVHRLAKRQTDELPNGQIELTLAP